MWLPVTLEYSWIETQVERSRLDPHRLARRDDGQKRKESDGQKHSSALLKVLILLKQNDSKLKWRHSLDWCFVHTHSRHTNFSNERLKYIRLMQSGCNGELDVDSTQSISVGIFVSSLIFRHIDTEPFWSLDSSQLDAVSPTARKI